SAPIGAAVNPKTNMVYVTNKKSDTISVINGTTDKVVDTIQQVGGPKSIAVNPNTNRIYVSITNNTIYVIDGTTDKEYSDIPVGYISNNIAVNPNTNRIYGDIGGHANRIFVINGSSSTLMTTFVSGNVSYSPVSLAVDPIMNILYVANAGSDTVSVINGTAGM